MARNEIELARTQELKKFHAWKSTLAGRSARRRIKQRYHPNTDAYLVSFAH